jgi:excisionase family DNA binding protein
MNVLEGESPAGTGLVAEASKASSAPQTVAAPPDNRSPFMTSEEAARFLRVSLRTIREMARLNQVPVRRPSGSRRLLFREDELREWIEGAELEVFELPRGGRIVRPV